MLVSITDEEILSTNKLINSYYVKNTDLSLRFNKKWDEEDVSKNYDKLLVARNLFDLSELKKSAYMLKDIADDLSDQSSMFMHHYAEWMHADMKMREEMYQAEYETSKSLSSLV